MTEEIRFITYPEKDKNGTASFDYDTSLEQLEKAVKEALDKTSGIIKLMSFAEGFTRQKAYYAEPINAIICDIFDESSLEAHYEAKLFPKLDKENTQSICHLENCGIMTTSEYEIVKQLFSKTGRNNILKDLAVVTIDPLKIHGHGSEMVYGIPVFRCQPEALSSLVEYFIQNKFLPVTASTPEHKKILAQIIHYQQNGGNILVQAQKPDADKLEEIKKYYRNKGNTAAMLKEYPPEIFQIQKGSWDLYRFVKCQKNSLKAGEGQWYEVSGMYARNPLDDLASDIDFVAIDFGTKSTVVAAFDSQSNINLIPIGMSADDLEKQYENPTIIRFVNIQQFLKDYENKPYRPDTKFNDVRVSHSALEQFEGTKKSKNQQATMLQYLNQLKQWINNPNRELFVVDMERKRFRLSMDSKDPHTINPVELYAYYIGLSINNMHQKKVYLKYYLSYSATYSKASCEQIRASFEKGLRKSLPEEVQELPDLNKRFKVKLWYDEAAAYAVCALNSYENHFRSLGQEGEFYLHDLKSGMFYSIYDFGGGTLDFSFGVMKSDPECKTYTLLKSGGASYLGCEYILEELAFTIFYNNREILQAKSIQCCRPSRFDQMQDDGGILADTSQARFNTNTLITFLREIWIGSSQKKQNSDTSHSINHTLVFYTSSNTQEALEISSDVARRAGLLLQPDIQADLSLNPDFSAEPLPGLNFPAEPSMNPDFPVENSTLEELVVSMDEIEDFFNSQIMKGIDLFYSYYKELVPKKELVSKKEQEDPYNLSEKKCHVFLAGNASKSPRVKRCFKQYMDKHGQRMFHIHPPLPTAWDENKKSKQLGISIPTAKSGVVHGLLMARPTAENICIINKLPEVKFHYHIGSRRFDPDGDAVKGQFHLLLAKSEVPKAQEGIFRKIRKIPKPMFELLYTDDDSYAMKSSDRDVSASITAAVITVPEKYVGQYLYICAQKDTDVCAELGVCEKDQEEPQNREHVHIIGTIDLPKVKFSPSSSKEDDITAPYSDKKDTPVPPDMTGQQADSYQLSIMNSDGAAVWEASTSDFSFDRAKQEHILTMETNGFQFCYQKHDEHDTVHQISVPVNAPGKKEIFILNITKEFEVYLGYRTIDWKYVEIFSINLKTESIEIKDQKKG